MPLYDYSFYREETREMLPFTRAQAQRGQGMTEYVIILVAIAIICIAITVQFGGKIKALFETADAEIDTVDSSL